MAALITLVDSNCLPWFGGATPVEADLDVLPMVMPERNFEIGTTTEERDRYACTSGHCFL